MKGFIEDIEKIYVVFADETSLWWLKFLKKGYRHCYVLISLDEEMTWIELNPMSTKTFIRIHQFLEKTDYISYLKTMTNNLVVESKVEDVGVRVAPIAWFSCVEYVKRLLGIQDFFVFTPYQLYLKLKSVGKKS